MTRQHNILFSVLFALVIISLALNIVFLWRWSSLQQQMNELAHITQYMLAETVINIDNLQRSTLEFTVPVNQSIHIQTEIPFKNDLHIPINKNIIIDQTIETQAFIEIPDLDVRVPMAVKIPVTVNTPISDDLVVPINGIIPVDVTIPLNLEAPIILQVQDTEFGVMLKDLRNNLVTINELIVNFDFE